jgi:hypothetical protein
VLLAVADQRRLAGVLEQNQADLLEVRTLLSQSELLNGAKGPEPPHGGIKIRLFPAFRQHVF